MKTVLITGSTSGIGLGIAIEFAKAGFNLILHGLELEGEKTARDIAIKYNVKTSFYNTDLSKPDQIVQMIDKIIKEFNSIDILINNAGIQFVSPIEDFPIEKWNQILQINLTSAFVTSKAVWSKMKENNFGRIINISSAHGLVASEYKIAYVTSKHALIGMTKVLALEGASFGITANSICPGYVKTPLVEKQIKDQAKSHGISEAEVVNRVMLDKQPIKEFNSIESIGKLAIFLASDDAKTITGTSLSVDGGWTAQ